MSFPWLNPEDKVPLVFPKEPEKPVAIVPSGDEKWLRKTQKELFEKSSSVIDDALSFRDIDPSQKEPPEEWVKELGKERAWKKYRVALAGWMSAKEAPVGFKVAKDVFVGISKALAVDNGAPKTLNMQAVQINLGGPAPEFPKITIDRSGSEK